MADERDRLGDKLRSRGTAVVNEWAAKGDRQLLDQLRHDAEERREKERKEKRQPHAFNRILCATDFGRWSLKALDLAKQIAAENDAYLYVVNICPTVVVPLGGVTTGTPEAEESARQKLEETAAKRVADVEHELVVVTGDPAECIVQLQSALSIDLIVMGTQGRSGVPRFFLGSVADRVIRRANCPVLTVKSK